MSQGISRRGVLGGAAGLAGAAAAPRGFAQAPATVKLGSVLPLSGPWAAIGQTIKDGLDFAVDDVNKAGGLKALGGARLELVAADAEDSVEKAKNAAQRLLSREADLVGGMGDALSGMTLAITDMTERAELPWITQTLADVLSERGFKHFFHANPVASAQAKLTLPVIVGMAKAASGKTPTSVSLVVDSNQALQGVAKTWREGEFAANGLRVVSDRTFTPPIADASQLVEEIRRGRPDFVCLLTTALPDQKLLLDKMNELGMGRGRMPTFSFAGTSGTPELLRVTGAEVLENFTGIFTNWPGRAHDDLAERFKARSGKPWMTGQVLDGYGQVMIFRDALERAAAADRRKVTEEIRKLDASAEAGRYFYGRLGWDERGRRKEGGMIAVQWQGGVPRAVFPPEVATAKPVWLGRGA